jgi:hypothetical protein
MGERYRELILAIEDPVSAPLTVTHICYDTAGGTAEVTHTDEFPPEVREACRYRVP